MSMENIRDLFLEDETFEDARNKFNTVLQRLFRSMIDTESNEGSITLKMDVTMQTEFIPNHDPDIKGESRCVRLPQFAYKVSSSITVKDEQKGNKNPQMELVWDDKQQKYVLQYVANTEQRSIFDKDFQEEMNGGSDQEGIETSPERDYLNVKQIAGPVADEGALPGDVTDPDSDAIDGDYREVDTGEAETGDFAGDADTDGETPDGDQETLPDGDNEADNAGYDYEDPEAPEWMHNRRMDLVTYHTLQRAEMQIIFGGVESNGCRYFQHRQEIPDHIRRPSVVGNRRRKDKERSRPALSADENAGDHRTARSGVNRPGRVPPLPVGYEQPPERCLCSHGGLGLPVCNDNYLAERQGWSGAVLPWNDGTLSVRNHKKETAV